MRQTPEIPCSTCHALCRDSCLHPFFFSANFSPHSAELHISRGNSTITPNHFMDIVSKISFGAQLNGIILILITLALRRQGALKRPCGDNRRFSPPAILSIMFFTSHPPLQRGFATKMFYNKGIIAKTRSAGQAARFKPLSRKFWI